jgi:putative phage-type endonuclease
MHIINLDQRTDAWKAWRNQGVTATDSTVILGASPYKTPWRLWAEKVGKILPPDLSKNPNVQRGVALEEEARLLFQNKHLTCVMPACAECDVDSIFRASFDGLTPLNEPVEFKCPGEKVLMEVRTEGLKAKTVQMYSVQVQHQMLVSGSNRGWLVFYDSTTKELIEFEIQRDETIIKRLLAEGRKFYECVTKKIEPPKDPLRDAFLPAEGEERMRWIAAARDFAQADREIEALQARINQLTVSRDEAKEKLIGMMGNNALADFAGVSLTRSAVKGRVDYAKLLEKVVGREPTEEEIESVRSKPTERWYVKRVDRDLPKDAVDDDLEKSLNKCDVGESLYW